METPKGGFFSESAIRFLNLQISKKEIFQKTILNLKFKIPVHNIILLLFQVQDSFFGIFFWRFEKRIELSEKKTPLGAEFTSKGILGINLDLLQRSL